MINKVKIFLAVILMAGSAMAQGMNDWAQGPKTPHVFSMSCKVTAVNGDLATPEGRAKFCRLNESGAFNKQDPDFPTHKIWVFNNQGEGMVVKKRSRVDPSLMEDVEYNADGIEISRSYEPA